MSGTERDRIIELKLALLWIIHFRIPKLFNGELEWKLGGFWCVLVIVLWGFFPTKGPTDFIPD